MAGEHPAEKLFNRVLIKNNLATQEDLDILYADAINWSKVNIAEELIHLGRIKAAHYEKIKPLLAEKGLKLPDYPKTPTITPKSTPVPAASPSSSSSHESELGFVEVDNISTEYQAPKPFFQLGEDKPAIRVDGQPAPVAPALETSSERYSVEDGMLTEESVCEPAGPGRDLAQLLGQARAKNASDLHISTGVQAFMRVDGALVRLDTPTYNASQIEPMLFNILNKTQRERLQKDLQLDFSLEFSDGSRYRSNIIKDRLGWSACFRLIPKTTPAFDKLGLPPIVKTLTEYNTGLVLVTGPKGCGKTTTLAAMIDLINSQRHDHIITMEDPIEYRHPGKLCQVTQRSLGAHTLSYANALRGALRQDPDVMLVGEMRDIDTISAAITAAETGHLVFGSLHTNSAARTIDRIIAAFPPDQQAQIRVMIAESIRGIICQELLPRADGKGQVLALEILLNNVSVRKMIVDSRTFQLDSVIQTSRKQGMVRMDDSINELLQKKVITRETALQYLRNTKAGG